MSHYKLAFLGFGNVGVALAELLLRKESEIKQKHNITFEVTGIATGRHGLAICPGGINLPQALSLVNDGKSLAPINQHPASTTVEDFILNCGADVLFEATPINYESGQPAVDYIRASLESGMHVFTANKGPVVHAYQSLTALAESKNVKFYFESTVMDGAPIFGLFRETLPASQIQGFRGVLNSTTNVILTRMENGESFDEAVAYAQSIGIAETDPSGDIDGWDAAVKLSALATVLMDIPTKPQDVTRTGIREITADDIALAKSKGMRWKLICEARWVDDQLQKTVSPQMVGVESPFFGINGTTSIVQIESDVLGKLSILEEDPGTHTTAYGMLADFLNAVQKS